MHGAAEARANDDLIEKGAAFLTQTPIVTTEDEFMTLAARARSEMSCDRPQNPLRMHNRHEIYRILISCCIGPTVVSGAASTPDAPMLYDRSG